MTVKSALPRYYSDPKEIRKQLPLMLPMVGMSVMGAIYATGFQNETTRMIMLYISLSLLVIVVFILLLSIPTKLTYYQIDSTGVHITILGAIHRHIYWSDIGSVEPAIIGNVDGIGLTYVNSFNRYVWGRKTRQKLLGWDEILVNSYAEDGASFAPEVTRYFKKHLRAANREYTE